MIHSLTLIGRLVGWWIGALQAGTVVGTLFLFPLGHTNRDGLVRIENFGVGVVLRSENPALKAGDHLYGMLRASKADVRLACQ